MQDVPQIEAFSIPIRVELTELMELHFDFVLNCAYELLRKWEIHQVETTLLKCEYLR